MIQVFPVFFQFIVRHSGVPVKRAQLVIIAGRLDIHHPLLQISDLAFLPGDESDQRRDDGKEKAIFFLLKKFFHAHTSYGLSALSSARCPLVNSIHSRAALERYRPFFQIA